MTPEQLKVYRTSFDNVATAVLQPSVKSAVLYLSPTQRLKATKIGKPCKRGLTEHLVFSLGRPNYAERRFVKLCQRAGEKFPLRKVQLRHFKKAG